MSGPSNRYNLLRKNNKCPRSRVSGWEIKENQLPYTLSFLPLLALPPRQPSIDHQALTLVTPQFFLYINSISPRLSPAFSRFLLLSPASLSCFPPLSQKEKDWSIAGNYWMIFPVFGELVDTYFVVRTLIWVGGHYLLFGYKGAGEK
jgi:hypothetical protein